MQIARKFFIPSFHKETLCVPITQHTLDVKAFESISLLHLSDLHIDNKTTIQEIQKLIRSINASSADFIVITGDLIDCSVQKIANKLLLFQKINKDVYFVSGNHDFVYGYGELCKFLRRIGWIILDNGYKIVSYNGCQFLLWGLSDRFSGFFGYKREPKRLMSKIAAIKLPKIFLAHQPKDYTYGLATESDLFLCGHTHAGQIYPFGYVVRLFQPFIKGVYRVDDMIIYVNSGLGTWGVPYRFGSKAEIVQLFFRKDCAQED